jgi:hypothetical protein
MHTIPRNASDESLVYQLEHVWSYVGSTTFLYDDKNEVRHKLLHAQFRLYGPVRS